MAGLENLSLISWIFLPRSAGKVQSEN